MPRQDRKMHSERESSNSRSSSELPAFLKRMKLNYDPTNLSSINVRSRICPSCCPITFSGVPMLVREVWKRMQAIEMRPFVTLDEANYKVFLKCVLSLCELKISIAQAECMNRPHYPLTEEMHYSDRERKILASLAFRLPFPLVCLLDAIGLFEADEQPVVPVLPRCDADPLCSGAINFGVTDIAALVNALREAQQDTTVRYKFGQRLNRLPGVEWNTIQRPSDGDEPAATLYRLTDNTIDFWGTKMPTKEQCTLFRQIIASLEYEPDFLQNYNLMWTGHGSIIQAVRFPDEYKPEEAQTRFYMNTNVPNLEVFYSSALMLGTEYEYGNFSRYCSGYECCFKRGFINQEKARRALIWANVHLH